MALVEINFDGIVGPSHNYAGLSLGNLASTRNAGQLSQPRAAALAGPRQDARQPRARPGAGHLRAAAAAQPRLAGRARRPTIERGRAGARRQRVVGLGDVGGQCRDGLARARHRRRQVPPDRRQPADHAAPQPRMAGDAGAAAARLRQRRPSRSTARCRRRSATRARPTTCGWRRRTASRGSRSSSTACRAAPSRRASISRRRRRSRGCTGSIPSGCLFAEQSEQAIAAGAFHNDVVAVANERVLFAHEQAFADKATLVAARASGSCPGFEYVEVADADVPLADAVRSYLFNAQLVTPPVGRDDADRPRRGARDARRCGAGSSGMSPATARSAGSRSSTFASRWPMAAARPACGCAWSPIRRRSIRASWSTRRSSTGIARGRRSHWPEAIDHARAAAAGADRGRRERAGRLQPCSRRSIWPTSPREVPKRDIAQLLTATLTLSLST